MKVREAIDRIDSLKHNTYTIGEKLDWLNRLDGMIKREIIDTHEGGDSVIFEGYTDRDLEKDLLIGYPYDEMYIRWLEAQIHYYNGEYGQYNQALAMYNAAFGAYVNHYNRTHMPNGQHFCYF